MISAQQKQKSIHTMQKRTHFKMTSQCKILDMLKINSVIIINIIIVVVAAVIIIIIIIIIVIIIVIIIIIIIIISYRLSSFNNSSKPALQYLVKKLGAKIHDPK